MKRISVMIGILVGILGMIDGAAEKDEKNQLPGRFAGKGIVVGLEYVVFNNKPLVLNMADAFAETGMTGMKHFPEAVQWDKMQKGPNEPIDWDTLDLFVREYQKRGFTELTLCLKSYSKWASRETGLLKKQNFTPKPQYQNLYENWIRSVVERYDGDGRDDMDGLRWPVRYFEIGSEFSSYEPEPVEEYIEMLRSAYKAAHQANGNAMVGHAPFLITPVDLNVKDPKEYEQVWKNTKRNDEHHGLEDQRIVLDHPECFDFINIHNLGAPNEIEHIMRWLEYETGLRNYSKPVVISDTTPTSYIGWGPATICVGPKLGLLAWPATEADRCRLAKFFTKLVDKDKKALDWVRGFVAADHVQRTVIAAEQGVKLINLSFTGDIEQAKWKFFRAAAGISAWGGALNVNLFTGAVLDRYPLFYSIQQMMTHINGYDSIRRLKMKDEKARVYVIRKKGKKFWIAWRDPQQVLLPEDGQPESRIILETGANAVEVEYVITGMGQKNPRKEKILCRKGEAQLALIHTPIYIFPK